MRLIPEPKKYCPAGKGCGKPFPLTREYWPKDATKTNGFGTYCKKCNANRVREYLHEKRKNNLTIITTSTHFRCEKMKAMLSKLECLKRQRDKGRKRNTSRYGNVSVFDKFEECLDCEQGKGIKEEIKALL